MTDDDLINNPAFHQAVRSHRITLTGGTARSHRTPIGLVVTVVAIGLAGVWALDQIAAAGWLR